MHALRSARDTYIPTENCELSKTEHILPDFFYYRTVLGMHFVLSMEEVTIKRRKDFSVGITVKF